MFTFIEVGKRLIAAKSLVQHGQWLNWLEKNFQLKDRMARNFMQCAERFSNWHLNADLNQTQLIALLALPDAEETEKFIAEKAAEGKRVLLKMFGLLLSKTQFGNYF